MSEHSPMPWRAAGVSVPGARHVQDGVVCQDAVLTRVEEDWAIVAVADGHGDPKHARSHEGSRLAVEVIADLMGQLARDVMDQPNTPHALELESELRRHLPRRIAWEWNRRARELAGQQSPDGTWHSDLTLFGTTLIGALFTRGFAVFYQLGDGDILYMSDDGTTEQVFTPSEELYGSLTWSMCMPDGSARAKVACRNLDEKRPQLAILATDGLRDSLPEDLHEFLRVGDWFLGRVEDEGWDLVVGGLGDWLSELSRRGNGDDATFGLVYWPWLEEDSV